MHNLDYLSLVWFYFEIILGDAPQPSTIEGQKLNELKFEMLWNQIPKNVLCIEMYRCPNMAIAFKDEKGGYSLGESSVY